ncbi:hypothetical protein ACS0TY_000581 [Phlomoides rotata]
MPPEPFPWDRRDFRKQERSASDPRFGGGGFVGGGGLNRWREQPQHPAAPPPHPPPFQQQQRWFSDFRPPRLLPPAEGHSKQGGWHVYSDDAGQGFVPLDSPYANRSLEDENCRPFGSRGNGRYIRNNRENRNPFTRKDRKAPTWEPAKSPIAPAKPITDVSNLMPVENTQQCSSRGNSFASHIPPSFVNLSEQSPSQPLMKETNNKNGGAADETASAGLESGKENCLKSVKWKPLKLARTGGLSSRDSCFSHSSSSKSVGVMSSTNIVAEVKSKNPTVVQSPADDACVRSTSPVISVETGSSRKRRLGWGEGLAKYEKKRVESPEDRVHKTELVVSVSNTETLQSVNLTEKSPGVASLSDCASPGTSSSVACSSSPVIEEKGHVKEADMDHDTTNLCCSSIIAPKIHYGAPAFNLQNLDLASIANLSLLINDLLQADDPTSAETGYGRTTSMNKLLVWKVDMLKALEMTESEIESLETELKSLIAEPRIFCSAGSCSLPGEEQLKPCEEPVTASKCGIKLVPLQINSSGEMVAENAPVGPEDVHVLLKDEDIDSPGSATSRSVEVLPAIFPSETSEDTEGSMNLNVDSARNLDDKCLKNGISCEEENHVLTETNLDDLAGVSSAHCRVDNVNDSILSSNRDAARKCMEQLNKLLPTHLHCKSSLESSISSLQSDPSVVKKKILKRKRFLRLKEKVLTLKFKAFRHFWKEGRVISTRKLRGKTQKKFDPTRNGHKRNHSSLHSRVSSHARGPHTVPADEVIELVNDLLSKSAFKPHGSTLKMPAMILDKEVKMSRFISNNGLVEDPCSVEKERSMLNPWTSEETEVFVDKLAAFGKDFGKIASFLDRRSVADCIEFYYKNHKSECFEKIKKNPASSNQIKSPSKTYLVASGKRRNPELNATSLDILGAASEIVANIDNGISSPLKLPSIFSHSASSSREAPMGGDGLLQASNDTNTNSDERETEAADVLASICGSLSSEGVSSCITSSVDKPVDGYQDHGGPRVYSPTKRPLTPDVTQVVDEMSDDEMSDVSCGELDSTDWSDEEKSIFVQAVSFYGKNFVMVSQRVGTRSENQCKLFFSKARKCLELDQIQPGGETETGGGSDSEGGCTVETGSAARNNVSECSMEENLPPADMKLNHQSDVVVSQNLRPDFEISDGSNGPVSKESSKVCTETVAVSSEQEVKEEDEKEVKEEDDRCVVDGLNEAEIAEDKDAANSGEVSVVSGAKPEPQPLANVSGPSSGDCQQHLPSEPLTNVSGPSSGDCQQHLPSESLTNVSGPSSGDCQQHLPGHSSSDSIAFSQVLWGYPVSVQTMSERIEDVKCENPTPRSAIPEQNSNLSSNRHTEFFLGKCNGSRQQSEVVEAPLPSLARSRDHSRPHSAGGTSRNGDVKLFGTILNSSQQKPNSFVQRTDGTNSTILNSSQQKPDNFVQGTDGNNRTVLNSSQQKPNNFVQRTDGNNRQDHRIGHEPLSLNIGAHQTPNLQSVQSKFDHNIPVGSLGFWDGNRIRTGVPPLPDSALLLAKYPAAFTNYVKLDQQPPLHGTVNSTDLRASSINGAADYQYPVLQPFTIGMNQRQDGVFNEVHRRNSFDLVSGMPNVVGRGGGVFVGGQGLSLSDPVTAMKMQYDAKIEQLRMKGGKLIQEVDRWISSRGGI